MKNSNGQHSQYTQLRCGIVEFNYMYAIIRDESYERGKKIIVAAKAEYVSISVMHDSCIPKRWKCPMKI